MLPNNQSTDPNENDKDEQNAGEDGVGEVGSDGRENEPLEVHRPGEPRED